MTAPDLFEKLEKAIQSRTVRTDRLKSLCDAVISRLDAIVTEDCAVHVDGACLERCTLRSNIGSCSLWFLTTDETVALERDVNSKGWRLHGDLNMEPLNGPTRGDLLAFAERARSFVLEILATTESDVEVLDRVYREVIGS